MTPEFKPFPKIPRLSRECIVTEKIDGTNASILIIEKDKPCPPTINGLVMSSYGHVFINADGTQKCTYILAGSRNRWITPANDNHSFAIWVRENGGELIKLGPGHHFGEWWGSGIQRGYGLTKGEKRFSLFNVSRWHLHGTEPQRIITADPRIEKWTEKLPPCVGLVPVLYRGFFDTTRVETQLAILAKNGSVAAPGYMNPEGVVVYHAAGNVSFKKTIYKDSEPKTNHKP
jgi:hypothetical protein